MKDMKRLWACLTLLTMTAAVAGGCGDKKKSGGGGGGGGTAEDNDGTSTGTGTGTTGGGNGSGAGGGTGTGTDTVSVAPPPPGAKEGFGCLQGVVVDGFTGKRIDVSAIAEPDGIFVLIHGRKLKASGYKNDPNLVGEYYICEIPVDETYPVFAYLPNFQMFESSVKIESTRAMKAPGGDQNFSTEVKIPDPIKLSNIKLFPLGSATRNLVVKVLHNGANVDGALVDLEPLAGSDHWAFDGTFAASAPDRLLPERMTTSGGSVTFPAAKLSLGTRYKVSVTAPADSDLSSAYAVREITLGISGATALDKNTYELFVALTDANKAAKAVSCSTQFMTYEGTGSLKILTNRAVKVIDPYTWDSGVSLSGTGTSAPIANDNTTLTLAADDDSTKAEKVSVTVSGNMVTLTPLFPTGKSIKPLNPAEDKNDTTTATYKNKDAKIVWDLSKFKVATEGDNDANNTATLSSLISGMSPACRTDVRFFKEID